MTSPFNPGSTPNPGTGPATSQNNNHTPNPEAQAPSQTQPFPDPQTFTFLPQLYNLISRLAPLQPNPRPNGTSTTSTRVSRSPTLTRRSGASNEGGDSTALHLTQTRSREETIEVKDLPALVYPLRQQVERAKDVVRALPDVQRSVVEQEREIRELEARIVGLKGRLGVLGRLAGGDGVRSEREDVVMQGLEG